LITIISYSDSFNCKNVIDYLQDQMQETCNWIL